MRTRGQAGCGGCFFTLFGSLFVAIGLAVALVLAGSLDADATRVERLPLITAGGVDGLGAGTTIVVQGSVSQRTPEQFRSFVAYRSQEYRGTDSDGDATWSTAEVVTPRLLLEMPGGPVEVAGGYTLSGSLVEWQDRPNLEFVGGRGTLRYSGIERGATVAAVGETVPGPEGVTLKATVVAGGTRDTYVADQRTGAGVARLVGGIFALVGGIFALSGVMMLLRAAAVAGGLLVLLNEALRRRA